LNLANILATRKGNDKDSSLIPVISDFGISISLANNRSTYSGNVSIVKGLDSPNTVGVTPYYAAPEFIKRKKVIRKAPVQKDLKIDIYAFAITIYELINQEFLSNSLKMKKSDFLIFIDSGFRPPLDTVKIKSFSDRFPHLDITRLISTCWDADPDIRPSAEDLINRTNG
jgi:serine/threonine protein kinase